MLDQQEKEWIEARFVKKDDCNDTQEKNAAKFANDDTRIKLFEQQINTWNKLFWVITTAVVAQLVTQVISLLGG